MASRSRYEASSGRPRGSSRDASASDEHAVVYQSRSGPPQVPWLEPDVCDHIRSLAAQGVKDVVVSPVGFVSDHMEILFDLDVEAREAAAEAGIGLRPRADGRHHPAFVA
jgi:ferrochelatase